MNFNLKSYFLLIRPINIFIGALTIWVGASLSGAIYPLGKVVLACVSGSLIMAGGNVINDYFDVEIDRVNKPLRPLPSNAVRLSSVSGFAIILFALG
ncbi:UbiA family prenyltransferase, partial [candidate division KSB1 bacterium]|nr:UbiA family prenyltransferase [candidate division KSB1 bacterium]